MGKRRKAREYALQILFQLEFNASDSELLMRRFWSFQKTVPEVKDYSNWLVEGIRAHENDVDQVIQTASENWRISRMAVVDRNILRIAVFELLHEKTLVPAIVINEALEIAKKYSGEDASVFINGILDAIRKTIASGKASVADNPAEGTQKETHGRKKSSAKSGA